MLGKSVLELGAGVGFDGVVAHAMGAKNVVITDGNTDVLQLAEKNIAVNCDSQDGRAVSTGQLRWNTEDEKAYKDTNWDYIFAADVTYLKKNRADLLASISNLSGQNTVTYISMEPRNVDEVNDVLKEAEAHGLRWTEEKLPVDPEKDMCGILCARMFSLRKL